MRPTAKLWRSLGGHGQLPEYAPRNEPCRLSDWFATHAEVAGKSMVLFAHRETIFTVFVPIATLEMVLVMFRQTLMSELTRIEIPTDIIDSEIEALTDIAIAKTDDRSVLGSLTQLASDLEWMADYDLERGSLNLEKLQSSLNRTPHVQRKESFAEDAVRKIFELDPRKKTF